MRAQCAPAAIAREHRRLGGPSRDATMTLMRMHRLLALVLALALGLGLLCSVAQATPSPATVMLPCPDGHEGVTPVDGQGEASMSCVPACCLAADGPAHRVRIGSALKPAPSLHPVPASFAQDPSDPPPRHRSTSENLAGAS